MPQITTIRVVRRRSLQPEQFGNATAEVEFHGTVLEGEDYKEVARQMLIDSRALVYENLGLRLPQKAVEQAKAVDTPTETAKVEVGTKTVEDKPKRGRPPKNSDKAEKVEKANKSDEVPSDEPNIRANPEDRKNPEDDEIPGDDSSELAAEEKEFTISDLFDYVNNNIKAGRLNVMQAKKMQKEMGIARIRDLDSPEKIKAAKVLIDKFIEENES